MTFLSIQQFICVFISTQLQLCLLVVLQCIHIIEISSMSLFLWYPHGNARVAKVLIAAQYAGIQIGHKQIGYQSIKLPEHLIINPFGKVPVLETPQGPIFQSFAILRYVARKANKLYGKNVWQQAQIENWLNSTLSQFVPFLSACVKAIVGIQTVTKDKFLETTRGLKNWSKSFNEYIEGKTYIVGDEISIADIAIVSYYHWLFRFIFDGKSRSELSNLIKWFENVSAAPQFRGILGKTWYVQKEFTPPFYAEQVTAVTQKVVQKPKVEKVQKNQKPKVEKKSQPQKQTKKKEEKQKKKNEEEQEQDEKPVEKKVNPLDLLPKSPFNLDDFKREISNNPDKHESVRLFWEKFDPVGWSLWKLVYQKYEGEGTVGYLTSNLKNGFLRNLDHFRKYAFAGFGVYGTEGNYEIQGAWLWRGTEIPEEMREHQSFEYYTVTKLDHTKEEDRALIDQYWANLKQGELVEGLPVYDVKHFK